MTLELLSSVLLIKLQIYMCHNLKCRKFKQLLFQPKSHKHATKVLSRQLDSKSQGQ